MITIGRVTNHNYDSWDDPPSNWGSRCCLIARGSMFNVVFPCVSLESHQTKGYIWIYHVHSYGSYGPFSSLIYPYVNGGFRQQTVKLSESNSKSMQKASKWSLFMKHMENVFQPTIFVCRVSSADHAYLIVTPPWVWEMEFPGSFCSIYKESWRELIDMSEWPNFMLLVIVGQMWKFDWNSYFWTKVTSVMVSDHGIAIIYVYFDRTNILTIHQHWNGHPKTTCAKGKALPKNQFYRICYRNLKSALLIIGICLCQITVVLAKQPSNSIYSCMCILTSKGKHK